MMLYPEVIHIVKLQHKCTKLYILTSIQTFASIAETGWLNSIFIVHDARGPFSSGYFWARNWNL